MIFKHERLWALAKSYAIGFRISDALMEKIISISERQVEVGIKAMITEAKHRAEANNRKTLMAHDI